MFFSIPGAIFNPDAHEVRSAFSYKILQNNNHNANGQIYCNSENVSIWDSFSLATASKYIFFSDINYVY